MNRDEGPPKRYTLVVEGWVPVSTNVLMRAHWSRRGRLLREDRQAVALAALAAGTPRAEGPRRVSVLVSGWGQGGGSPPDPDNVLKSALDAVKAARLLVDDGPDWCVLGSVEVVRGPRRTMFVLEDLVLAQPPATPPAAPASGGGHSRRQQAGHRL